MREKHEIQQKKEQDSLPKIIEDQDFEKENQAKELLGFCLEVYASQPWWTPAAPLWCPTTAVPPSKQLKHHGPGWGLDLSTKRMQGQCTTIVLARRLK